MRNYLLFFAQDNLNLLIECFKKKTSKKKNKTFISKLEIKIPLKKFEIFFLSFILS